MYKLSIHICTLLSSYYTPFSDFVVAYLFFFSGFSFGALLGVRVCFFLKFL
jgi:hypothetical protein